MTYFSSYSGEEKDNLKTLKDMVHLEIISPNQWIKLKAEAIKITNNCDMGKFWQWCRDKYGVDYTDKNLFPIDFIKLFCEWFFNLTEGDLNGKPIVNLRELNLGGKLVE